VDDRCVMDLLVNANGLVYNCRLDRLTLNDGLDCKACQYRTRGTEKTALTSLVDVVVLVLVDVLTKVRGRPLGVELSLRVLVHGALLVELRLVLREHVFLVLAGHGLSGGGDVLGREGLVVRDGLDTVL
jgi:hypothetical protein